VRGEGEREGNSLIEDTIGVGRTRANREDVSMETLGVIINIIELRTSGVPSGDHCSHTQAISSVGIPGGGVRRIMGEWGTDIVLARSLEAAATEIRSLFRSS
jgi:hypothetical protein